MKLDDHVSDYLLLRGFNSPSKVAKILDVDVNSVLLKLNEFRPNTTNKVETIDNVSTLEKNIYMRNQLLRDSDAMSMQHGVEIRVPFLDNEFLSLISSIKTEILFKISGQKSLLINAFKDVLPDDIWNRPKKGFQFPFKEWFKDSEFIKDKMSSTLKQKEYDSFNIDNIHWSKIWALAQV